MSTNNGFWGKLKAAANRGVDRAEKQTPGTKEGLRATGNLTSSLAKTVFRAHGIDSVGAYDTSYPSGGNSGDVASNYQSSSRGPQFGEGGTAGRYPQGVDSTTQQPVAQSSTGAPYEINSPKVEIDPKNVNWPPSKFK